MMMEEQAGGCSKAPAVELHDHSHASHCQHAEAFLNMELSISQLFTGSWISSPNSHVGQKTMEL